MESVGQPLKAARESKRMSVSDVASETRIQVQTISAIENDDFSSAPAPIYARGFIKLYAECVGINPAPLINIYNTRYMPGVQTQIPDKTRTPKEATLSFTFTSGRRPKPGAVAPETRTHRVRFRLPKLNVALLTGIHWSSYRIPRINLGTFSGINWPRLNTTKIETAVQSEIQRLRLKISKFPALHFQLPVETWQTILSVVMALILAIAAVAGFFWYLRGNQPQLSEPRRIQEPPAPYLDSPVK